MDASVVICTYNRADLLGDSIAAIQRQNCPADRYEIIVVDNNSTDGTAELVRQMAADSPVLLRYIFEGQQGLSHARNTGIRNAQADIVAFVDDDIDAGEKWLSAIVDAFEDKNVVAAGGPIRPVWPYEKPDWLTERWQGFFTINEYHAARKAGEYVPPSYPWGANMAFRKDIITSVGMFSAELGRVGSSLLSCEEKCLFTRIFAAGGKVAFAPDAVIFHKIPASRLNKLWLYHRTYWQGRSDAVIDLQEGKDLYQNVLKNLTILSRSWTQRGKTDFDQRCTEKTAFGYIQQVLSGGTGKAEFRRVRALKIVLKTLLDVNSPVVDDSNQSGEYSNRYVQELLRQKDEQIKELTDSLSWRIAKPLRILHSVLSRSLRQVKR